MMPPEGTPNPYQEFFEAAAKWQEMNAVRHPKWGEPVPAGTHIRKGQPYRVESKTNKGVADEGIMSGNDFKVPGELRNLWFVDTTWEGQELPTELSVIRARIRRGYAVTLFGPTEGGWWAHERAGSVSADEIISFEVLWTEGKEDA